MQQRKEVPPGQQLESLRKARDHYNQLADQIRNAAPDKNESTEDRQAREQNARRVAAAYENSFNIQNALLGGQK
jgi:cysteinyl-tRNA synthetase